MTYTVEVYKKDARTKTGERLIHKGDFHCSDRIQLGHAIEDLWPAAQEHRFEIYETWVTRVNIQTGEQYQERYDTPRACSLASEMYWSA